MTVEKVKPVECRSYLAGRKVAIVEAPVSFGQALTGVASAPRVLQAAGLQRVIASLAWEIAAVEAVDVTIPEELLSPPVETEGMYTDAEVPKGRQLGCALERVHNSVKRQAESGNFVLTVGGDHSIASATISAMLKTHPNLCVVWVDAHADVNTPETSGSKKYHGMPVAHLFKDKFLKKVPGFDWLEEAPRLEECRIGYIGLRQVDEGERQLIIKHNIAAKSMTEVDECKIAQCVNDVLAAVDPESNRPIHVSFDIDACDPSIAPGTGTRARGGLTYREAHYICEMLSRTGRLVSMDMVEVNPDIDQLDEAMHGDDENIDVNATKTVRLAMELVASSLGKAILL